VAEKRRVVGEETRHPANVVILNTVCWPPPVAIIGETRLLLPRRASPRLLTVSPPLSQSSTVLSTAGGITVFARPPRWGSAVYDHESENVAYICLISQHNCYPRNTQNTITNGGARQQAAMPCSYLAQQRWCWFRCWAKSFFTARLVTYEVLICLFFLFAFVSHFIFAAYFFESVRGNITVKPIHHTF